jgi:regulator of cell morphogenesis and NO signaling
MMVLVAAPFRHGSGLGSENTSPPLLDLLINHIHLRFHERHREDLPELMSLARQVESDTARTAPTPRGLPSMLEEFRSLLEPHMEMEETILFPAMRFGYASEIESSAYRMLREHDLQQIALASIEKAAKELAATEAESCKSLHEGLITFCRDLKDHIWLENDVLLSVFGRFRAQPQMLS